jgi:hypothetical protein
MASDKRKIGVRHWDGICEWHGMERGLVFGARHTSGFVLELKVEVV